MLLALVTVLALVVGACTTATPAAPPVEAPPGEAPPEEAPPEEAPPEAPMALDTLRFTLSGEPATLDVNLATDTTSHAVMNQLMTSFYDYRPDGSIVPAGATEYTVSADGRSYTLSLRGDALWSDGEPVTAQHFVDGMIRLADPATAAEYAWLMYFIDGLEGFNTGETDDPSTVGIRAVDDLTLEITLTEPLAFFPSILAFFTTYPVRLDVIAQHGDSWTEAGNFVGNGAYTLSEWEHEDHLLLEKNELFFGADNVAIQSIFYPIISEAATSLAAYENDEVDVSGYPSEELPRILEDPVLSQEFHRTPRPGTYFIGLNTLRAPTDNVNMRIALAKSVDRRSILDNVLNMPWREVAQATIPPGIPAFQGTAVGYDYDPEGAVEALNAYMAEAGIEDASDIVVWIWFNRGNEDTIEAVGAQWSDNLGITVNFQNREWATYLSVLDECNNTPENLASCEFNGYRLGWVMDYGDANNMVNEVWAPNSPFNYTGYASGTPAISAEITDLLAQGLAATDSAARIAIYEEVDRLLVEDAVVVVPIFHYDRTAMIKSYVSFEYPPFGQAYFKDWGLEAAA